MIRKQDMLIKAHNQVGRRPFMGCGDDVAR